MYDGTFTPFTQPPNLGYGTLGTVFISSQSPIAPPRYAFERTANEIRADAIIDDWKDSKGGWEKLRKLIVEALEEQEG